MIDVIDICVIAISTMMCWHSCSGDVSAHEKAHLRQNNSLLAAYLDHFDSIAEEVDHKGGRNEDYYLKQTAHRLKANVRSLRQVDCPACCQNAAPRSALVKFRATYHAMLLAAQLSFTAGH